MPNAQRRPRTVPLGLLGAIAVVAVGERSVARHSVDVTGQASWEWRLSAEAARRGPPDGAVIAFGSSLTKLGIAPRVIEPAVGRPVVNLGICTGPAPANYFLLRRVLDSGVRPSAVLVEFHPLVLLRSPWHALAFWPDLLDTREAFEYAYQARDPSYFAAVTLARLLPSLKDRHGVRDLVRSALAGEAVPPSRMGVLALRRNVGINRGAMIVPANPVEPSRTIIPPEESAVAPDSWECSALNERYVERFLALAQEHDVPVVWVMTPVHPRLQALRDANGLDGRFRDFVRRMVADRGNVRVVDATRAGFPHACFIDSQHLNRDGAVSFSAGLVPTLAAVLNREAAGHWVSLGPPSTPIGSMAIEDYGMSVRSVRQIAVKVNSDSEVIR